MYINHALINALSAHMMPINLNTKIIQSMYICKKKKVLLMQFT